MTLAASASAARIGLGPGLGLRIALLAAVLCLEKLLLNVFVDFDAAQAAVGFGAFLRIAQHLGLRALVSLVAAVALFAALRPSVELTELDQELRRLAIAPPWLAVHALLVTLLVPLSHWLYGGEAAPLAFTTLVALWLLVALLAVLALLRSMAPWRLWERAARGLGVVWLYAAAAAVAALLTLEWSPQLWAPSARLTFFLVERLLAPLLPQLQGDATTLILSTPRFAVQVSEVCSGLEGAGLMAGFCIVWLVFFRGDYRFPRALLLIPVALVLALALNVVRIGALMLIGHFGRPGVAVYGFHSQAGWIAFNAVAGGVAYASRRIGWLQRSAATPDPGSARATTNPTAVYLMPLLAVLAAGMLSRALSSGFEALYGLRLVAGGLALWHYRQPLRALDWRCSARGVAAGAAVAAVWLFAAALKLEQAPMPAALEAWPAAPRTLWIVLRVLGAVCIAPVVEELAYRGYLLRRLCVAEFESLPLRAARPWALVASAAAFGAGHGVLWIPGLLAGLVYGLVAMRTGRLGESVAAHATSNALLATAVLATGRWQLW